MPATAPAPSRFDTLAREHAEWRPWLALLETTARGIDDPSWRDAVPAPSTTSDAPLLAVPEIVIDGAVTERFFRSLLRIVAQHGVAGLASMANVRSVQIAEVMHAAIAEDAARLTQIAASSGVEANALAAIASLVAMPLLHACRTAWEPRLSPSWIRGSCPVCGAWPTLAEARGLEQTRRLRCARCGGDWRYDWLRCPYCGVADHHRLGSLVSQTAGQTRKVDTCLDCRGYIKTLTTIAPILPGDVALDDLATVDLDAAALSRGFRRPPASARTKAPRVVVRDSGLLRRLARSWS